MAAAPFGGPIRGSSPGEVTTRPMRAGGRSGETLSVLSQAPGAGGPVIGGGEPKSSADVPERRSTPPVGSAGLVESWGDRPRTAAPEPRSRGPPRAAGGAAAFGGTTDTVSAAFGSRLPNVYERALLDGEFELPYARGPPVDLIDNQMVWPALSWELLDLPGRMLGFGWRHPVYAPGGRLAMFAETYGDLRSLTKAGLLTRSWWQRFVRHEVLHLDELFDVLGVDHVADEAALVADLPMPARIKLGLGAARAATVSELAARLGGTEAEILAAVASWDRLVVSPGGVVVAWPAGQRARLPDPAVGTDRSWRSRIAGAKEFRNQDQLLFAGELADAMRAGVAPVRVGTTEARQLMDEGGQLKWVLRADGTLWISPPLGALPDGRVVEISHAVVGAGRPALAAGEIFLLPGGSGAAINVLSGHYHSRNSLEDNVDTRALGRAAFAHHGTQIPFDFVFRDETETETSDPSTPRS